MSCGDDFFGPVVKSSACRGGFDFTVLFEESILSIGPSALFLLAVPFRISYLARQRTKVRKTSLHDIKLSAIILYACSQLSLLILWSINHSDAPAASIASSALTFTSALGLGVLSHLEHNRSIRPSFLISFYLFCSLILDIARVRTQWLLPHNDTSAAILTAALSLKLIILSLEALEKRRFLISIYRELSPEATSGMFNRSLFWWLHPLLRAGSGKVLAQDDLLSISETLDSQRLTNELQKTWNQGKHGGDKKLMWDVLYTFRWTLAAIAAPRLCVVGLSLAQPFLIQETIAFVENSDGIDSDQNGYGIIGAFVVVYIGLAIFNGWYEHLVFRFVTMVRGSLIGLVFGKMIELKVGTVNESAALTLMGTDIERIVEAWTFISDIWANTIQLALAVWLLERQLGIICVIPVVMAIIASSISFISSTFITKRQRAWFEAIQKRVNSTSELLGSMKSVKMLGLVNCMQSLIHRMRTTEIKLSKRYRGLNALNICLINIPSAITPAITFMAFAAIAASKSNTPLMVSQAFTSLSILDLLTMPLAMLVSCIPQLFSAMACFQRLQDFLEKDSRMDHRLSLLDRDESSKSDHTQPASGDFELQNISNSSKTASFRETENAVVIENGSFGWSLEKDILHDINVQILDGSLVIITGPVGSGKSTLLNVILGEIPSSKGFVYVRASRSAFCEQTPWIRRATIRENIVGESVYDEIWYNEVIKACALDTDLDFMPAGDQTPVGSGGATLSGGQKQRVSLARALYARESLVMLDDILSGLDAATEAMVFKKVFGPQGLLKKSGTTCIIVTHAVHRLLEADHIIVLSQDGQILEQGTYSQLSKAGSYVEGLALEDNRLSEQETEIVSRSEKVVEQVPIADSEAMADLRRKTGDLSLYKYYGASMGWLALSVFLAAIMADGVFQALQYLWLNWWTSANQQAAGSSDHNSRLGYWSGIYVVFGLMKSISIVIAVFWMGIILTPRSGQKIHSKLLQAAMRAPMAFFGKTDTGVLINRFSQDIRLVDITLPSALINTLFQIASIITSAVLMTLAINYIGVVLVPVIGVLYLIQNFYLKTSRQLRLMEIEAKAPLYSHFIESLAGLTTIRAFGWSEASIQQNITLLDASQKPFYLLMCIQRWLSLVLDLTVAGTAISLVGLAVPFRSTTEAGLLGIALVNVMDLSITLTHMIKSWTLLETSLGAVARVRSFVRETPSEIDDDHIVPPNWPQQGQIAFDHLSVSHDAESENVLSNITFTIAPGERIGICGRSGSGKSSLISSLFRLTEITDGAITIDGVDITKIDLGTLRSSLNALSQDPLLFTETVRLNADPFAKCTDAEIIEALGKVQLWDGISSKGGLDAIVDSGLLSHGQRQLFCLGRAMLRKGKILVLDEPTSSVDSETDKVMQELIRSEFKDHTIIMIAHRLETLLDFDRIAVLDNGKLIELDPPEELLSRDSRFRELYNSR